MELVERTLTSEKRKYPRFNVDLPVMYTRSNLSFRYGRAVNASQSGLLVYLREEMGVGERLTLKLFFPSPSEFNTLEMFVQVVWKDVHLRKDWTWDYRTGVRIVDVSLENMTKLRDLLVSSAEKPSYTA